MSKYSLTGKYKRALVTGGAGFVGSHLCDSLLADGLEVVSFDNYVSGKDENLALASQNSLFTRVDGDVRDQRAVEEAMEGVDIVFHQAASKMTVCLTSPDLDLQVNAWGSFNLLSNSISAGVKKFIHVSTGSVYGQSETFPTKEADAVNPESYYGVSKLAGEKYARLFSSMYGLNTSILRYFHVYGPRQENSDVGGVVTIFARNVLMGEPIKIYGDGSQIRSFTSVHDVVEINKFCASNLSASGEAYNCNSGTYVSILQLAEMVRERLGAPEHPIEYHDWRKGDVKYFNVSNDKLRAEGFEWEVPFEKGLDETLNWSRQWIKKQG